MCQCGTCLKEDIEFVVKCLWPRVSGFADLGVWLQQGIKAWGDFCTHCVAQKSSIGARGGRDKSLSPTYVQIRPVSTRLREPPNGSNFTFKLAVSCTIARSNVNVIHDLGVSIFDRETTSSLERSSECSLCSRDEHCTTFSVPWNLPNAY